MPDRHSLVSTIWLASLLTLLASVLVAPIRTSGFVAVASRAGDAPTHFALSPGQPTILLGAATAADPLQQVNALPFEDEEQDRADAPGEPRVPFLIPCSFRKAPDRQSIAPRSIPSLYPLRC